jgi:hypothetical protein
MISNESIMFDGKLTISRIGNTSEDYMQIELSDSNSGLRVLDVEIDVVELMRAITNLGYRPCKFRLYAVKDVGDIGKKKIVKTIKMRIPKEIYSNSYKDRGAEVYKYASPLCEVDGWEINNRGDLSNHHKIDKYDGDDVIINALICKYVEVENDNT